MGTSRSPINIMDEVRLVSFAVLGTVKRIAAKSIDGFNAVFTVDNQLRGQFYRDQGIAHTKHGRYWQALPLLEQAVAQWPNDEETLFHLGYCYLKTEQTMEGIQVLERASRVEGASPRVSSILGMAYIQAKEYVKAVELLKKAIQKSPNNFNLHYRLGLALDHLGEYEGAIAAFQDALQIRPGEIKVYQSIGFVLEQQGKHDEAVVFFKKTTDLKEAFQDS